MWENDTQYILYMYSTNVWRGFGLLSMLMMNCRKYTYAQILPDILPKIFTYYVYSCSQYACSMLLG